MKGNYKEKLLHDELPTTSAKFNVFSQTNKTTKSKQRKTINMKTK
jgi:hypothetical protein